VIVGSDAHVASRVGEFGKVKKLFAQIEMPEDLIMNRSVKALKNYLKGKGKERFS
jgi:putative hydrolase